MGMEHMRECFMMEALAIKKLLSLIISPPDEKILIPLSRGLDRRELILGLDCFYLSYVSSCLQKVLQCFTHRLIYGAFC